MFDEEFNDYPAPEPAPDEFNPHSPNFYQNIPEKTGDYVNDAFSRGYTDENGNNSGEFSTDDGFQGFQGYYDNSGFENYEGYKGPDPYYRGYYGNTGYNPSGRESMPVTPPLSSKFVPDYEKLRNNSKNFYYQGYKDDEQQQTIAPQIKKEDYDMSFAHFSSISHFWSAISLLVMFGVSYAVAYFAVPQSGSFLEAVKNNNLSIVIAIIPVLIFVMSGGIIYKITKKASTSLVTFLLILYGAFAGLTITPCLVFFLRQTALTMTYSYLAVAVTIGVISVLGFILNKNITSMAGIIVSGLIALVILYYIFHYMGITDFDRNATLTYTAILFFYASFETFAVKRTYEEYISDDKTMYKNAIISSLGHYISIATVCLRFISKGADFATTDTNTKS